MFALALLAWLDISVLAEISNLWIPAKWPWNMASTLKHYILLAEWGKKSSFFQKLKKKKKNYKLFLKMSSQPDYIPAVMKKEFFKYRRTSCWHGWRATLVFKCIQNKNERPEFIRWWWKSHIHFSVKLWHKNTRLCQRSSSDQKLEYWK